METHRAEKSNNPTPRRLIAAVIGAGALADAVVAIDQAWNLFTGPEPVNVAQIGPVAYRRNATMSEYAAMQAAAAGADDAAGDVLVQPALLHDRTPRRASVRRMT